MELIIGDFIFSPRPSYAIEEKEFVPNLRDNGSNTCSSCDDGPIKNWEIIFVVRCIGNGDMYAARRNYHRVETFLSSICSNNKQLYKRNYCDEPYVQHIITSGYIKPIDLDWNRDDTTLSGEVHLITSDTDDFAQIVYDVDVPAPNG